MVIIRLCLAILLCTAAATLGRTAAAEQCWSPAFGRLGATLERIELDNELRLERDKTALVCQSSSGRDLPLDKVHCCVAGDMARCAPPDGLVYELDLATCHEASLSGASQVIVMELPSLAEPAPATRTMDDIVGDLLAKGIQSHTQVDISRPTELATLPESSDDRKRVGFIFAGLIPALAGVLGLICLGAWAKARRMMRARTTSSWAPNLGAVPVITYIVLGGVQFFAISDGIEVGLDLNSVVAFIIAVLLAYVPLVGTIAGLYGAISVWNWPWLGAIALFSFPYVAMFVVGILISSVGPARNRS